MGFVRDANKQERADVDASHGLSHRKTNRAVNKGGDPLPEKKFKQVCECKNCGNEAEMMVTCNLEEVDEAEPVAAAPKVKPKEAKKQVKGHAVCSHCGNEADMWVDL